MISPYECSIIEDKLDDEFIYVVRHVTGNRQTDLGKVVGAGHVWTARSNTGLDRQEVHSVAEGIRWLCDLYNAT